MRILAFNPGHDGACVLLESGRLTYSLEGEKDNRPRYDRIHLALFLRSLGFEEHPDVVAISGFIDDMNLETVVGDAVESLDESDAGYWSEGDTGKISRTFLFAGRSTHHFSSSHVRSHIMCCYGLSPFPQGQRCYVLIWEGLIGAFYYIDEQVRIKKIGDVLRYPGHRYIASYVLASGKSLSGDPAGKVMALAAYGRRGEPTAAEREFVDVLMEMDFAKINALLRGESYPSIQNYYEVGVESKEFKDLAWQVSEAIFGRFHAFAQRHITPGLPLLIAGGCGLNCDWNSHWRHCGLFSDVFVPPCPNDSGVALGAAVDAQHHYTGCAKISWNVYAGEPFVEDVVSSSYFDCVPLDLPTVCRWILNGKVIAWVQGRYEIGPRALGNRSLLAEPFSEKARDKLNRIKQRERYRPVAPICLEEEFDRHFENHGPSPHMLYFQRVKSPTLGAVTHVDGSARAQTVNDQQNPEFSELLREFRKQSGVAVLCNTSLNFNGRGFVNHLSQLFRLANERGIDGIVVGGKFWGRRVETPH